MFIRQATKLISITLSTVFLNSICMANESVQSSGSIMNWQIIIMFLVIGFCAAILVWLVLKDSHSSNDDTEIDQKKLTCYYNKYRTRAF